MMKLKTFILIALSMVALPLVQKAYAGCGGWDEYAGPNADLFFVTRPLDFDRFPNAYADESVDFWCRYVGAALSRDQVEESIRTLSADDLADVANSDNALLATLHKRHDTNAIAYLRCNDRLYEMMNVASWDYHKPSRTEYGRLLQQIAQLRPNAQLAPRVVYLRLRCNFAAGNLDAVLHIWRTECERWAEGPLRRRAYGYVGGVYYQRHDFARALEIFDQLGDKQSINRCVGRLINLDFLESYCADHPNSVVLPYVMQDYANFLYHAKHREVDEESKMRISVLRDYDRMMALSRRLLNDSRVKDKFIWQAFIGFLQFADHDDEAACQSFDRALQLGGTPEQRTHITMLRFAASLGVVNKPAGYEGYFVSKLAEAKKIRDEYIDAPYSEETYEKQASPFVRSIYYLFNYELAMRSANYCRALGNDDALFVVYSIFGENPMVEEPGDDMANYLYFRTYIDEELTALQLETRLNALKQNAAKDAMLSGLMQLADDDLLPVLEEMVGTKYMRLGQFAKAEPYLAKSTPQLLAAQAIAPYLNQRKMPTVPFARQNTRNMDFEPVDNPANIKLQFCRDMMQRTARLASLRGEAYAEQAYQLANMYFQASPAGDLWALTNYGWSCGEDYGPYNDFAIDLLHKAILQTHNFALLKKCYFALASVPQKPRNEDDLWTPKVQYDGNARTYVFHVWGSEKEGYDWLKRNLAANDPLLKTCDYLKYYK